MEKKILIDNEEKIDISDFSALKRGAKNSKYDFYDTVLVDNTSGYVIIDNTRASSSKKSSLLMDDEEEKFYAEEVYDEGDDSLLDDIHDREVEKEVRLSFSEIAMNLNTALKSNGINNDKFALDLLASMQFSRLMNIKPNDDFKEGLERLFISLDNPKFIVNFDTEDTIASSTMCLEILNYAKDNPFKAVFVYIDNVVTKDLFKFIRPFYSYIDNPNGDLFITTQNKSLYIPHNIYFFVSLTDDDSIYSINRRLLRYVATIANGLTLGEEEGERSTYPLDTRALMKAKRDSNDAYAISESNWKKLDKVIELVKRVNNYSLDNKISRRLEDYTVTYLSSGEDEIISFDRGIALNLAQEMLVINKKKAYKDVNVIKEMNNQFGTANMAMTKEAFTRYLKYNEKEGE